MNCDVHTVNILVETKFYLSTACSYNQYIIQQVQLENALVGLLKKPILLLFLHIILLLLLHKVWLLCSAL